MTCLMGWFSIGNCYILWKGIHRGDSHWKGVWRCAAVMAPFFQAIRRSLTVNVPLWLPFLMFYKIFAFSAMFWPKFYLSRPKFFKENPLPRPYILKPPWHTSTRKKLSALPGCIGLLRDRSQTHLARGAWCNKYLSRKLFASPLQTAKKKKKKKKKKNQGINKTLHSEVALALRVRAFFHKTVWVCHVYCNFNWFHVSDYRNFWNTERWKCFN